MNSQYPNNYELQETEPLVAKSTHFLLSHFEGQCKLFPRKIMTPFTGGQKIVYSIQEVLGEFRKANFVDCRISAFPEFDKGEEIYQNTPTIIFIDLDLKDFPDRDGLDDELTNVLSKIKRDVNGHPTIVWSGGGYHILLPTKPPQDTCETELSLENITQFAEFKKIIKHDMTTEFMRYAGSYFSEMKDSNNNPSINSCLLRVPNSINSKYGNSVEIVQEWNGNRASIEKLIPSFWTHLNNVKYSRISLKPNSNHIISKNKIGWIEKLLKTPIEDYRKITVALILVPYLVVVRRYDENTTLNIISEWLNSCSKLRKIDAVMYQHIRYAIKSTNRVKIPPMSIETIKSSRPNLFEWLRNRNVVNR